jgi:signal transduction histidine kinase
LCRFHPLTHAVLSFGLSDGLPGEEFNRFHHLQLPDGQLAFGGVKGWVLLDPVHIRVDTTKPVVALTGLTINNQPVDQYGVRSPLVQPLNYLSELPLRYDQNYLTVDFAALQYHQPDRVTYRYQLRGYDGGWTTSRRPTASYTKLPPGQYTLRVNAANAAGQWSQQVKELRIVVQPPLWASGWAYVLYTLLLGSAIFGVIQFRMTRARERQELILRQRQTEKLRQLDEAKTRFFANVSHELRTPLTLMLGPLSSVLNRGRLDARDEQLIRTADNSAHQLLRLVNELLDLTRLEAGKLGLQLQSVRLETLLRESIEPFEQQARQMGNVLTLNLACVGDPIVQLDAGKLGRVIQNLLANACKFTPPGGNIDVRATCEDNRLRLWIRDTGRGIHPDDLPHIFDRYFQTHQANVPLEGGTGIGLALCQELVRLMQGTITVKVPGDMAVRFA